MNAAPGDEDREQEPDIMADSENISYTSKDVEVVEEVSGASEQLPAIHEMAPSSDA